MSEVTALSPAEFMALERFLRSCPAHLEEAALVEIRRRAEWLRSLPGQEEHALSVAILAVTEEVLS